MNVKTISGQKTIILQSDLIWNALDIVIQILPDDVDEIYLYRQPRACGINVTKSEFIRLVESIKPKYA